MDAADFDNKSNASDDEQEQKALSEASSKDQTDDNELEQNPSQVQTDNTSTATKDKKESKEAKKNPKSKVIFNVSDTRYEVVRYTGRKLLGYKLTKEPEVEWDVFWTDQAVQPETLARMQPFQKINHFPGMYSLARKNHLGRNLMRMKKAFPNSYKFFPQTYLLPAEYSEFKAQFAQKGPKTFIVKPEASCQGRGIFLTKSADSVQPGEHYVVQRYLQKPFLLDNLKFDIRLYVLLAGCDPMRIYLYNDGLARFATEDYVAPTAANIDNMCMHLTNYAINKDNPNFVFNEDAAKTDVGHKRSLKSVFKVLEERGYDVKGLWNDIKKIIIKMFCSVQPILAHNYKSCQPEEPSNNMCFEILGLDFILDHKLKPWLLEVNHTPSFTTDTPFDKQIKRGVIKDALKLMNISVNHRIRYKNKKKVELQQRVLTGKKTKATPEERQAACQKAQAERDAWENKHLGDYEKVYPFDDPSQAEENYDEFIECAHKWWENWTGTATKKVVRKTDAAENGKLPPMTFGGSNQNVRAKEIQNIYSQKMKVPPATTQKAPPSNQKLRQTAGFTGPTTKLQDSPNSQIKSQPASLSNTAGGINPWVLGQENNPLAQDQLIGEDDNDYLDHMIPIVEQDDINGEDDDEPQITQQSEVRAQMDTGSHSPSAATTTTAPSRDKVGSPITDNSSKPPYSAMRSGGPQTEIITDQQSQMDMAKATSFRIRRTTGTSNSVRNDNSRKGTPSEKENIAKSATAKRPSAMINSLQRLAGIYSASYTRSERDELAENQKEKEKPGRNPYKYMTAVSSEVMDGTDRAPTDQEHFVERRHKSSTMTDVERQTGARGGSNPRTLTKKVTMNAVQQAKTAAGLNGNFLTPKLFELNIHGTKNDVPKSSLIGSMVHGGGQKNFGKVGKTLQIAKDIMNQASYSNEAQSNFHKYFGMQIDNKK